MSSERDAMIERITLLAALAGLAFLPGCSEVTGPAAGTLANHVETMRDYDLTELEGKPPLRPIRFYIGENSAFAACAKCLCVTGIMTGRYPELGIKTTSASPTLACERESTAFDADASLLEIFFQMSRAQAVGELLVFQSDDGKEMTFQLGGANLSPP